MLRDANIICLSSIDWEFNRQNPQEVALGFAGAGNRVLFIENTGVRRVQWSDLPRLWSRLTNWWRARGGVRHTGHAVDVFSPVLLPSPYLHAASAINARILLRVIRRWVRKGGDGPLIVITFLPTPLALAVIHALQASLVIYYCIDRLAETSAAARKVAESETKLLAEADLVLVTSRELYDAAKPLASRVEMLVSGVRCEEFAEARRGRSRPHAAFEGLQGPIIGFVGSLRDSTDLELLAQAARLAPDMNFVLVGPQFADVSALAALDNVRLTGAIPHAEVIEYVARFDVGILAYVPNAYTAAVMPVKLKEYLAAGLPVVATPLPEVLSFAAQHPDLISFANDAEGFVSALQTALAQNTPEAEQRRAVAARGYDWTHQIERMSEFVEEELERRSPASLAPSRADTIIAT